MNRVLVGTVACVAFLAPLSLEAEMCTLDQVPAATLLVPYFEVDTVASNGVNTLISLHNATSEPVLTNVVFWTDYSLHTIEFPIYLTGYDVARLDLRDLFQNGNIPITADLQSDTNDDISPAGFSAWDRSFDNCEQFFPFLNNPVITASSLNRLVKGHTGKPISDNVDLCLGSDQGDNIARGYITMDSVNRCTVDRPGDAGYFDGPAPIANAKNVLWGDFRIVDEANDFNFTESLVHIEADLLFDSSSTDSGYTFYGRYTKALGGVDHREPLGTVWGARYRNAAPSDGTDFIVWRDSTSGLTPPSVGCGEAPDWFPMNEQQVRCWNEEEDMVSVCGADAVGGNDPACFPLETQRVATESLNLPFTSGWCELDLGTDDSFNGDVDFPAPGSTLAQSYVFAVARASGLFELSMPGLQIGHACDALTPEAGQ